MLSDGFDLVVLGTVLLVLLQEKVWGLRPASASIVRSAVGSRVRVDAWFRGLATTSRLRQEVVEAVVDPV